MNSDAGRVTRRLARRERRERLGGLAMIVLGFLVAVVCVIALQHPYGSGQGAAAATGTRSQAPAATQPTTHPSTRPSTHASSSPTPRTTTPEPHSSSTAVPPAKLKTIPIVVLNGTGLVGVAAQAGVVLDAAGWRVAQLANLSGAAGVSTVYFDPAVPDAQAAAQTLRQQFNWIAAVAPRTDALPSGPLLIVLTAPIAPRGAPPGGHS